MFGSKELGEKKRKESKFFVLLGLANPLEKGKEKREF